MENKICKNCNGSFVIDDTDLAYYKKISVPLPTHCAECRMQRRLAARCERALYKRKCDLCGKSVISILREGGGKFPVYCRECFWSDKWDPMKFSQDFDFNRSFFDQFEELQNKVPRMCIFTNKSENSDYTCHSFQNKNCYLSFRIKDCEEVYFSSQGLNNKFCMDCLSCTQCELCYECLDLFNCYNCRYLNYAKNCSDSILGYDLVGCRNCFGCSGLRNVEYFIFNEKKSREEYETFIKNFDFCDRAAFNINMRKFKDVALKIPRKNLSAVNNENCLGDYLYVSKNSQYCFESEELEDCRYCTFTFRDRYCYDMHGVGDSELCYEVMGVEEVYDIKFSFLSDNCKNSEYLSLCFNSNDLFGCIGLKHKKFCILNKQYSEEEYRQLVPRIIEHMKASGEYGEFFPVQKSPYCYNESAAMEYYPMSREEVLGKGWKWLTRDEKEYLPQKYPVPEKISEVSERILEGILACKNCGKNFKIIAPEFNFYKKHGLPIPEKCADCRHKDRLGLRNSRSIRDAVCAKCGEKMETTYPENFTGKVYCEKCYLGN